MIRFGYLHLSQRCSTTNRISRSLFDYLGSVRIDLSMWCVNSYIYFTSNGVSVLGALCYAEIGTVIPRNGAEIVYMKEGILNETFSRRLILEKIDCLLAYRYWISSSTNGRCPGIFVRVD